jgi:hypothetical protein
VRPATRTVPLVGRRSAFTSFSAVVLPPPLGPTSAIVSPSATSSVKPSRIARPLGARTTTSSNATKLTSARARASRTRA